MLYCSSCLLGYSCYHVTYLSPDNKKDVWRTRPYDSHHRYGFSYQSYSRKAGSLFVSDAHPNVYYTDLSKYTNVNYQSLCRENIEDRFLVYDSSKVQIILDKCIEELKRTNINATLYEYKIHESVMFIDYSNTTDERNEISPIKDCYGAGNYVLIIRSLPNDNDTEAGFETGNDIRRLTCENAIKSVRTKEAIYVYGSDDNLYEDHQHLSFDTFTSQQDDNLITKYTSRSINSIPNTARLTTLRYCYIEDHKGIITRIAEEFIRLEQFYILDDKVIIRDVSSMIYLGYISVSSELDPYILHCFIALE